jgi:osmotically-inducible protein OsmY
VTLTGHLVNFSEKYAAEHAVRRVGGAKALAVEIEVRLSPSYKRSDSDIASAVQRAIDWNVVVPDNCIQPKVENGWLPLNGEMESNYQRQAAKPPSALHATRTASLASPTSSRSNPK